MIASSIRTVDGVNFIDKVEFLEPDGYISGLSFHYVPKNTIDDLKPFMGSYRVIDFQPNCRSYRIARRPFPYLPIKLCLLMGRSYWFVIRFLYDNARFFKQIPDGQRFSWRYFTPYTWFKKPPPIKY